MEYEVLARATSHRGEIVLRHRRQRDEDRDPDHDEGPTILELRVNGVFVMDSAENSSELALAQAALQLSVSPRSVLIGGLGLGFTTHEVLSDPRVEHVVVAEIEEALVGWFRDGTVPHGRGYLADRRLAISVADVQQVVLEAHPDSYDLVLLDVDNGPEFLIYEENRHIYQPEFLRHIGLAMREEGILVIWSAAEDRTLAERMQTVFGNCQTETHPVVLQGRDEAYWLHIARKRGHPTPTSEEQHRA